MQDKRNLNYRSIMPKGVDVYGMEPDFESISERYLRR